MEASPSLHPHPNPQQQHPQHDEEPTSPGAAFRGTTTFLVALITACDCRCLMKDLNLHENKKNKLTHNKPTQKTNQNKKLTPWPGPLARLSLHVSLNRFTRSSFDKQCTHRPQNRLIRSEESPLTTLIVRACSSLFTRPI